MCDTFAPRLARGAGRVIVERIPYFAEQIVEFLRRGRTAHPGRGQAAGVVLRLSRQAELGPAGRRARSSTSPMPTRTASARSKPWPALWAPARPSRASPPSPGRTLADRRVNQYTVGQVIARHLPEGAILSDEGATASGGTVLATVTGAAARPPHAHRRLDRPGHSAGDRRGRRLPRSQGRLHPGRWRRDVHAPGAVDPGAREARRRPR